MTSSIVGVRLRPSDLVAVRVPPGPRWPQLLDAVWHAGAAMLPLDHRLAAVEVSRALRRARPTVLVTDSDARRRRDGIPAEAGPGVVVASSGSTGMPRFAVLSRDAVTAAVRASAEALGAAAGEPWLLCIPPAHIGGLLVLLRGVVLRVDVLAPAHTDIASVAAARSARFTSLVPLQLRRLLESGADVAHLRAVLVGGDRVDAALLERARAAGLRVVTTYGQTESCGGVVYDGFPLNGVSVRVGHNDEIELAGATLMDGYRLDPAASALAFTGEGWLRTGDAGAIDRDGSLTVRGRIGEVIITGGEKVYPAEVESALRSHGEIGEVAVVGRDDPEWGQRVVAIVVPLHREQPPRLEELREFVSERIARYKAPRELVIVERLPLTGSGKVRRDRLGAVLDAQASTSRADSVSGRSVRPLR
jgi:O-succinylbenzoic acid--CoA ligase